ncbi:MAG: hypothetical protein DWQ37_22795 [Planctomycetota bacterium]|nr:MAG: hypothetical protein DWQ37_22795 [Planctomycetota bacterium]
MQNILEYIRELLKRWIVLMTSTVFAAAATVWGLLQGPPIAWWIVVGVVVAFVVIAGYGAWKEKRDALNRQLHLDAKAAVLTRALEEANKQWHMGVSARTQAEAVEWIAAYERWIESVRSVFTAALGRSEATVILQIGADASEAIQSVSDDIGAGYPPQRERLAFLKHHMRQMREALKRYLPVSKVDL